MLEVDKKKKEKNSADNNINKINKKITKSKSLPQELQLHQYW